MEKKQLLIELQYLPPIAWWIKWFQYKGLLLEKQESYSKGTYRNRAYIAGVNGPLRLSIPLLKGKNQGQKITDVRIDYSIPWYAQHWTSIRSAYGNSPFWNFYADDLEPLIKSKKTYLFEYNLDLIQHLKTIISLDHDLLFTEGYQKEPSKNIIDFRNSIHPKAAKNLNDPSYQLLPYSQIFESQNGFLANLSILDLLFCKGPESILYIENSCTPKTFN